MKQTLLQNFNLDAHMDEDDKGNPMTVVDVQMFLPLPMAGPDGGQMGLVTETIMVPMPGDAWEKLVASVERARTGAPKIDVAPAGALGALQRPLSRNGLKGRSK